MVKLGLIFEFIGFCMLFWQSASRPTRKIENGGGTATTPADEDLQMQKVLKSIPSNSVRFCLAKYWQAAAFGLISIGVLCQLLSCS